MLARTFHAISAAATRNCSKSSRLVGSPFRIWRGLATLGGSKAYNPQDDVDSTDVSQIPNARDIENLGEIDVYGFDFDYTLASYNSKLQSLIYSMAAKFLVDKLSYPHFIRELDYDENFAIRGLHYDPTKAFLFKLDHLYNLQPGSAYFGRHRLSLSELQHAYGRGLHVSANVRRELRMLNDLFSLSEACLLTDVVEILVGKNIDFEPKAVSDDVLRALEYVHASGYMHEEVRLNFGKYVKADPLLRDALVRLVNAGKSLFLLTNSPPAFIDAGMKYLVGEDWRQLFHVSMCSADKPRWYNSSRPFRKVSDNYAIDFNRVTAFEPNSVYVHGSLDELHRITGWEGRKVLYWGDQLYTDLVQPGKMRGWRTGAIIRELETEVDKQNTTVYRESLSHVLQLERILSKLYSESPDSPEIRRLKNVRNLLRYDLKVMFNNNFGSVFRTHTNPTPLAYHLQRDADIYTSRLENLNSYSLNHCFYVERRYLPHETMIVPKVSERYKLSES